MMLWMQNLRLSAFLKSSCRPISLHTQSEKTCSVWKLAGRNRKRRLLYGGVLASAGVGSCGVLMYLSTKSFKQDDLVDTWKSLLAFDDHTSEKDNNGFLNEDHLLGLGWEDDCLVFYQAISDPKADRQETGLFSQRNLIDVLSPWEQSTSDDPWVLLNLTKSTNFWVRQIGVASLANKVDWDAFKYRSVAQACDCRTTVALARYPHSSDKFFLPPPRLQATQKEVLLEAQDVLASMPVPDKMTSSIQYYRCQGLHKEIPFQTDPLSMDLMPQPHLMAGDNQKKENQTLEHCLQAFMAYTAESKYTEDFVKHHGLAILQRLMEDKSKDWVQVSVLSILCNLSCRPELMESIVKTGWIHHLRAWSRSENSSLSFLALTTLANLDQDWISRYSYQDMVLLHPTQRNSQAVKADIVLVHGLRGGAVKTWRQRDSHEGKPAECHSWPKAWLAEDIPGVRIISVGYNTSLHGWGDQNPYEKERRTLEGRAKELMQKLQKAGVGTRPIIWMGHSMGGLLIKQMLAFAKDTQDHAHFQHCTKGVIMYSVPHRGSTIVDILMHAKYLLFPSVEVQELRSDSHRLRRLQDIFIDSMSEFAVPCLSFGESVKMDLGMPLAKVLVVSEDSSNPGIGEYLSIPADHINICKPVSKEDPIYQHTHTFISSVLHRL